MLAGLVATIGLGLYFQAIHKPLSRKVARFKFQIEKSERRVDELKRQFPQLNKQRQTIQSLNAECQHRLEKIEEIERKLPSRGNISQLLGEITRRAKGVKLVSIRQEMKERRTESDWEYSLISIEVKFIAPYQETIDCIRKIEAISPFLTIEEVEISEPKDKEVVGGPAVRLLLSSLLGEVPFVQQLSPGEVEEPVPITKDIFASRAKPVSKVVDLKLEGITFNPKDPTAIIDGQVVRVGSLVGDRRVKKILKDSVVLSDGQEEHILSVER